MLDLIIIGAGPGGYEAAFEAARLGLSAALVEKEVLGGTCLNRGCIPTKTLIHAADVYREIEECGRFGIVSGRPSVDMKMLQEHRKTTVESLQKGIAMRLKAAKIPVYQGTGTIQSDEENELDSGKEKQVCVTAPDGSETLLEAKNILIATGSVPSVPPIPGSDLPGVMTSDDLLFYDGEPLESLLIIGGGVIGVEFAGIGQSLGTKVTILEVLPSLIANMDRELGQSLKLSLKKKGADIHTGAKVSALAQTPEGICCTYTEKDGEHSCTAQAVLIATGRRAYTGGLFSAGCTPEMERGRILVNDWYETSIPGIYAVGDVNGQIQLAHAATAQGLRAVRHIAGRAVDAEPDLIPSCIYSSPEIASVGLTAEEAKVRGITAKSHKILSSANGKSVLTLQERGFIKVVYETDTHVILGVHLLCARATDMVSEFAVAIREKLTLEQMAAVVRPHPSFSEMITEAVRI
ncbi:MAG: dihydrolipoyl dehydrogenase [Clostridiales bacterium]|nr:dihydrolipoyl dehydrogenase [Clostridiales bacterium]